MLRLEVLSGRGHCTAFAAEILELRNVSFWNILYTVHCTKDLSARPTRGTAAESAMSAWVPPIEVQIQVQGPIRGEGARLERGAQRSQHSASAARQRCILGPSLKG